MGTTMKVALISAILPRMMLYCILFAILVRGSEGGGVAQCYGFQFDLSTMITLIPWIKKQI